MGRIREIPNHLKANMKALQSLSFSIKSKHSGAKRNILFDDDALDLVMDFCLGEGQPWKRVTARQAKLKTKNTGTGGPGFRVQDGELDLILGEGATQE